MLTEGKDFREFVLAYTNAATLVREDFRDTEDLAGVFSGPDAEHRHDNQSSWAYEGASVEPAVGDRDARHDERTAEGGPAAAAAGRSESHGSGGAPMHPDVPRDETLTHPRCVYQLLKRHFARYTPEFVEQICGVPRETFLRVCDALTEIGSRAHLHPRVRGGLDTTRWSWLGRHIGDFGGMSPTKENVSFTGVTSFRFRNGKIVEGWWNWDNLAMLRQVGAITP